MPTQEALMPHDYVALRDDCYEMIEMSLADVRLLIQEMPMKPDTADDLANALDEEQGMVYSGARPAGYVIIKIVP